jgi:hypothetical protein
MATADRPSVKTPLFRGSFVNLIKPRKGDKDDPNSKETYQILIPLKKDSPATKAFIKELLACIAKASAEKHGQAIPPKRLKHFPVKDGDTFDNEEFHGFWCIRAASNFKPSVVSVSGDPLLTTDEVYSGAWYKAKLSAWGWNNPKSGKGVSLNIESAIKMKDDARIGGGSNAADDFKDDITEGGDDDGLGGDDDLGDILG